MTDTVDTASGSASDLDYDSDRSLQERSLLIWIKPAALVETDCSDSSNSTDEEAELIDLHTAASLGAYNFIKDAAVRGEDIDKQNKGGWTPLMYASYIGHDSVVQLLLEHGANVNARNGKGRTALMLGVSCGNERTVQILFKAGALLEEEDRRGWTALFHATYAGHQNVVRYLLRIRANMEVKEPNLGLTPFMMAAAEGHEIIVQEFLRQGVDVNARARSGDVALSLALVNGHIKVVSLIETFASTKVAAQTDGSSASSGDKKDGVCDIHAGPKMINRLFDKKHQHPGVPEGYVTFPQENEEPASSPVRSRDLSSPIDPSDHKVSSSDGESTGSTDGTSDDVFTQTGVYTVKSSSGSSDSLEAAFSLARSHSMGSYDRHKDRCAKSRNQVSAMRQRTSDPSGGGKVNPADVLNQDNLPEQLQTNKTTKANVKVVTSTASGSPRSAPRTSPSTESGLVAVAEQGACTKLAALLSSHGLGKYVSVFEREDVDLQVFLTLTDADLKHIGIDKFGPRKKMTNAISKWHAEAPTQKAQSRRDPKMDALKAQILQEKELRSVAEECFSKEQKLRQRERRAAVDVQKQCNEMHEAIRRLRLGLTDLKQKIQECCPNPVTAVQQEAQPQQHSHSLGRLSAATLQQRHRAAEKAVNSLDTFVDDLNRAALLASLSSGKIVGLSAPDMLRVQLPGQHPTQGPQQATNQTRPRQQTTNQSHATGNAQRYSGITQNTIVQL